MWLAIKPPPPPIGYGRIYDPIASGVVSIVLSFSMSDDADKQQRLLEKDANMFG